MLMLLTFQAFFWIIAFALFVFGELIADTLRAFSRETRDVLKLGFVSVLAFVLSMLN